MDIHNGWADYAVTEISMLSRQRREMELGTSDCLEEEVTRGGFLSICHISALTILYDLCTQSHNSIRTSLLYPEILDAWDIHEQTVADKFTLLFYLGRCKQAIIANNM